MILLQAGIFTSLALETPQSDWRANRTVAMLSPSGLLLQENGREASRASVQDHLMRALDKGPLGALDQIAACIVSYTFLQLERQGLRTLISAPHPDCEISFVRIVGGLQTGHDTAVRIYSE